jgi:hypothetical protein
MLSWIFIVLASLKKTVGRQTCFSIRTHYHDFEPTSICFYSLMLHIYQRSSQYEWVQRSTATQGEHANHSTHNVEWESSHNVLLIIGLALFQVILQVVGISSQCFTHHWVSIIPSNTTGSGNHLKMFYSSLG